MISSDFPQCWVPGGGRELHLHRHIQNSSGTYQSSYPMGIADCAPQGRGDVMLTIHLHFMEKVKNEWSSISMYTRRLKKTGNSRLLLLLCHSFPSPTNKLTLFG